MRGNDDRGHESCGSGASEWSLKDIYNYRQVLENSLKKIESKGNLALFGLFCVYCYLHSCWSSPSRILGSSLIWPVFWEWLPPDWTYIWFVRIQCQGKRFTEDTPHSHSGGFYQTEVWQQCRSNQMSIIMVNKPHWYNLTVMGNYMHGSYCN